MSSLNKMPDVVLTAIMDYLDLRSIMFLRKTCRDFRTFIDEVVPSSSIIGMGLTVNQERIELGLEDSIAEFRKVTYSKPDQEAAFWKDLEMILKHQKSHLEYFTVDLEPSENHRTLDKSTLEKLHSVFLEKLQNLLISRKAPLKAASLNLVVGDQNEIMTILPNIESEKLEEILIFPATGPHMRVFKLDRVVETEQWKHAKELGTANFMVEEPLEKFTHFEKCRICVDKISLELLQKLKETFFNHPTLESFELHHEPHYKCRELKHWFEQLFEGSYPDEVYQDRWYSRIPGNSEEVLSIRSSYFDWITFSRCKFSEIQRSII
ncbi:unnamed protein product [Caenorhabditis nigoni]